MLLLSISLNVLIAQSTYELVKWVGYWPKCEWLWCCAEGNDESDNEVVANDCLYRGNAVDDDDVVSVAVVVDATLAEEKGYDFVSDGTMW